MWAVYDRLRSASLSVKYYGCRLQHVERVNFWLDLMLFAAAPSSTIAGLGFWKFGMGPFAWQALGAIAAIIAIVKPLLGLAKRIKEYEGMLVGYRTLEYDLMELRTSVSQKRKYDTTLQAQFQKVQQRERVLIGKTPDPRENARLKARCQAEVLKELPADSFFVPEE